MSNKITWIEPDRPALPQDWPVIINNNTGTAYQDVNEYLQDLQIILDEQAQNPNTPSE